MTSRRPRRDLADVVDRDGVDGGEHLGGRPEVAGEQLGLADARHPRAGVLEAEDETAAHLALAAGELLGGEAVRRRPSRARRAQISSTSSTFFGMQPA